MVFVSYVFFESDLIWDWFVIVNVLIWRGDVVKFLGDGGVWNWVGMMKFVFVMSFCID